MNCTQTRFLLYAHLDREVSSCEAEALSRHLAECGSCAARARSARGLANLLRSHMDRTPAPPGLVVRLRRGDPAQVRPRLPAFAAAAGQNQRDRAPGESLTGVIVFDPKQVGTKQRLTLFVRGEDSAELAHVTIQQ